MLSHSNRPIEPRHLLVLQISVILLFAALGLGAYLRRERDDALAKAISDAQGITRFLEEYVKRTVEAADLLLTSAEVLPSRGHIAAISQHLPEARAVIITDASGHGVAVNAGAGERPVDMGDRPYWADLHRVPLHTGLRVGPMLHTRFGGGLAFTVARPLLDAQGRFAGATTVVISALPFEQVFHSLGLGPNAAVAVFNHDGDFVLRQPNPDVAFGRSAPPDSPIRQAAASSPEGALRTISPLDGVERIHAYRTIPELGIVVTAGLAVADVLAPWRDRAQTAMAVFILVVLVVGGLTQLAYRSLRREQAIQRGLEEEVRLRTEEAQARAEEARQAEATKTRFLAAASHDLRQPLQAMEMFAEVLASQLTTPSQQQVCIHLRRALGSANQLLTTLLDVSSLESGKVRPSIATFPIAEVFAALRPQIEPQAQQKGLSFRIIDSSAQVVTDPTLLERLLRNLLVNAVRYTPAGGVLLGCRRRGAHVLVQVVDTGVGIPADKLATVFEDFVQLSAKGGEGRGLGLGVVRRTANLLDLRLGVTSLPGRGSIFSVSIPLARVAQTTLCFTAARP